MTPPDPLKAKLGFEREAEEIYIPWNTDDDQYRWVCRKAIAAALEAAFSKGTEEGYRKGWNACQIEAAKIASWKCGEAVADHIRALKPAKGESK